MAEPPKLRMRERLRTLVDWLRGHSREAHLFDLECPLGHRHPTLVFSRKTAPFEAGEVTLSGCPDDKADPSNVRFVHSAPRAQA